MFGPSALPTFRRYAVALGAVAVAWALRLMLHPLAGLTSRCSCGSSARSSSARGTAGWGRGLFATLLSSLVAGVVLFEPHPGLFMRNTGQYIQIVVFIAISTFVSLFCGHVRRSREQFAAALSDPRRPDTTGATGAAGELLELARLKRLEGEMGRVVAHSESLQEIFQGCVSALVTHAGAAFARIWTLDAPRRPSSSRPARASTRTSTDPTAACPWASSRSA